MNIRAAAMRYISRNVWHDIGAVLIGYGLGHLIFNVLGVTL
jgi:hypothetical protein